MSDTQTSALQTKLDSLLQDAVPALKAATGYTWTFERTRTKNEHDAKWIFTVTLKGKVKPLVIKSLVPARELVKAKARIVVLHQSKDEIWIGYVPNLDGLIAQLKNTPLWVSRVERAIAKTMEELGGANSPLAGA